MTLNYHDSRIKTLTEVKPSRPTFSYPDIIHLCACVLVAGRTGSFGSAELSGGGSWLQCCCERLQGRTAQILAHWHAQSSGRNKGSWQLCQWHLHKQQSALYRLRV